jgi:hypothetical protein
MEIAPTLRALLLVNKLPLGLSLGTPRVALTRPDWFRPSSVDKWNFAGGVIEGNEVAWTIDPSQGVLSEARIVVAPKPGLLAAILELYTREFGKPRLLKRNDERAWTIEAGIKTTLSVSVRPGGVVVVNLAPAKGAKLELVEVPRETSMKVPPSLDTLIAKTFDVKLGAETTDEKTVELKFPDAKGGFPKTGKLEREVIDGVLQAVLFELPDFGAEGEAFADSYAALLSAMLGHFGKPKSTRRTTSSQTLLESTWPLADGLTIKVWSNEYSTPSQEVPNRTVGVEYRAGE